MWATSVLSQARGLVRLSDSSIFPCSPMTGLVLLRNGFSRREDPRHSGHDARAVQELLLDACSTLSHQEGPKSYWSSAQGEWAYLDNCPAAVGYPSSNFTGASDDAAPVETSILTYGFACSGFPISVLARGHVSSKQAVTYIKRCCHERW